MTKVKVVEGQTVAIRRAWGAPGTVVVDAMEELLSRAVARVTTALQVQLEVMMPQAASRA